MIELEESHPKEEMMKFIDDKVSLEIMKINERINIIDKERIRTRKENKDKLQEYHQKLVDFVQVHKIERKKDLYDLHCEINEILCKVKITKKFSLK